MNKKDLNSQLFIGNEYCDAKSGKTMDVINPTTGKVMGQAAAAGREDVLRAIEVAQDAYDNGPWRDTPPREKQIVLNRFADLFEKNIEEFYELETLNNGRPIRETRAQISRLHTFYRYFASLAVTLRNDVIPIEGPYLDYTTRVPLGVVALMPSFNHPLMILTKSFAPALASGNSMIIKPSSLTPLTAAKLVGLTKEAGIPDGVVNFISGRGEEAGDTLVSHPNIKKIVLTGGTETGALVAQAAAKNFSRTVLELGGKGAVVIMDDIDLDRAVNGATFASMIGAGQTCICGSRILVHEKIYKPFLEKFKKKVGSIRYGDPAEIKTQLGPVISKAAQKRIIGMIEQAKTEGAKVLTGGNIPSDAPEGGFFVEPTVLYDCNSSMTIAQKEVFGPCTIVIPFKDEEDAIKIANDTDFGLGMSIWTTEIARAHRMAHKMIFGMVWINDHHRLDPASPWGGFKQSGIGRETGVESFLQFTEPRAVIVNLTGETIDWYADDKFLRLN